MTRLGATRREPRRHSWPLFAAGLALLALCCSAPQHKAPERPTPPKTDAAAPPTEGRVSFECEPAAAEIRVDGARVGTAAEINARGGLTLPFGGHRFELTYPGHQTFRVELNIGEQPETIRVKLQPLEPAP